MGLPDSGADPGRRVSTTRTSDVKTLRVAPRTASTSFPKRAQRVGLVVCYGGILSSTFPGLTL